MSDFKGLDDELRVLGEAPLQPEELESLPEGSDGEEALLLSEIFDKAIEGEAVNEPALSELESRRVWNRIEARWTERASKQSGGKARPRRWPKVAFGIAVAATLIVIPFLVPNPSPEDSGELDELRMAAHLGLKALGYEEGSDSRRARKVARAFERRLEEQG